MAEKSSFPSYSYFFASSFFSAFLGVLCG